MTSRVVDPELRTGWDDEPILTVINKRNESIRLVLEFVTSPEGKGKAARWSRVVFNVVWYYRWIEADVGYEPDNPDDFEFALIEITDSALVQDFLARGRWPSDNGAADPRMILGPDPVRHFRIGFDDHGTYDVLCGDIHVERNVGTRSERGSVSHR